jgi:RNA 2',3'-cyclic 3'-phosphodiesterase
MMPDRIRAFVALRLSAEVERVVADFVDALRPAGNSRGAVRWVRRANLHLTLRFLGDRVEAETLERLDRALIRIAATTANFTVGVRGTGAFPNLTRPRVVWAGLESTELIALASGIERAAIESGLAPERRAYSPHLTIGRVRDLGGFSDIRPAIEAAAERAFGDSAAQSVILYRSTLAVGSASYAELARYPFGGGS